MLRDERLTDKSIAFASRIVKLHSFLTEQKKEYVISKLHIALKEAAETGYWLKLLLITEYITQQEYTSMESDCSEIMRILTASINTAKNNFHKRKVGFADFLP